MLGIFSQTSENRITFSNLYQYWIFSKYSPKLFLSYNFDDSLLVKSHLKEIRSIGIEIIIAREYNVLSVGESGEIEKWEKNQLTKGHDSRSESCFRLCPNHDSKANMTYLNYYILIALSEKYITRSKIVGSNIYKEYQHIINSLKNDSSYGNKLIILRLDNCVIPEELIKIFYYPLGQILNLLFHIIKIKT
jgi:hypothetical protein